MITKIPARGGLRRGRISLLILAALLAACAPRPTPAPEPGKTAPATSTPAPGLTPTPTPTASLTPEPAWYEQIDASYAALEFRYGLVSDPAARLYLSLADAADRTGNFGTLPNAPAYVLVRDEALRDGRTFYSVSYYDNWMAAEDLQLVTPSTFRGLRLTREVGFRFGWVLYEVQSVNAAGERVRPYRRYEVVHEVPAATVNPGFVAVGPDEWLPDESLALTRAAVPSDSGPDTCRFIYTDLSEQTLRVYNECRLVFATLVSTGKQPGWTRAGRYGVVQKFPHLKLEPPPGSISIYYLEAVPYFMTYYGDLGFHGAYWHDDFGAPVSHGCINLAPADARWLYEWAWMGERVIISAGE